MLHRKSCATPWLTSALWAGAAIVAFAANSILCRLALKGEAISASGFTSLRLMSGALVLYLIMGLRGTRRTLAFRTHIPSAAMLATYAVAFSFAYVALDTGTGALILFSVVQITMILHHLGRGGSLTKRELSGITIAVIGLLCLVYPNISRPSLLGVGLMTIAGIAWALYTISGYGSTDPLKNTTGNFVAALPIAVMLIPGLVTGHMSYSGILLAVLSGGVASGLGYTAWYYALDSLSPSMAAALQLLVPVVAAAGGAIFVSEQITLLFMLSGTLIIFGVALVSLKPGGHSER